MVATASTFELATSRLLIRPWLPQDRGALRQMVDDREMMRYVTGDKSWSEADIDAFLERQARHVARDGVCMGALCLRETGEVVGVAGAQHLDRMDAWDIGWWVWKEYWGRGFATEAARAIVDYVFGPMKKTSVIACIDPGNVASIRVAERIGMHKSGETTADNTASWRPATPVWLYRAVRSLLPAA